MRSDRSGFTMVEVIIALLILTVGILGLAGTTALVVRQVTGSRIGTERAAALQSAIEEIKAMDYDEVPATGSNTYGQYTVTWQAANDGRTKLVWLITEGPGLRVLTGNVASLGIVTDTFTYRMVQP